MAESILEVLRVFSEEKVPPFATYLLNNREVAWSAFKKYKRYVESWKPVTANVIYHGRNVPLNKLGDYPKGAGILFDAPTQFNSWTTKKSRTEYFQRGPGYGVVLQTKTPPASKIFNVHSLMHDVLGRSRTS